MRENCSIKMRSDLEFRQERIRKRLVERKRERENNDEQKRNSLDLQDSAGVVYRDKRH